MQTGSSRFKIEISGRTYPRNREVDRFQIPFDELDDFRIGLVPRQSHLEISGLPVPAQFDVELYAVNGSSDEELSLFVYGGPSVECGSPEAATRMLEKMRRRLPELMEGSAINPYGRPTETSAYCHFSRYFNGNPEARLKDICEDIATQIRLLAEPACRVFICHAAEDKPTARRIARAIRGAKSDVWLDEWEIRVGDSIVQRINAGLSEATHIAVLLSAASCSKPWVQKEWSAALMLQLAQNSISVLPVRLDDSPMPPILADIRYADCRDNLRRGISELNASLSAYQGG